MTTTNHSSRPGRDGAGISVQWSDAVSNSSVTASLLGSTLRVHIDTDGTVTIRGAEDAIPSSYRAPDVYSPARSLDIHMSLTNLELLLDSAKQAIKEWNQKQNRI